MNSLPRFPSMIILCSLASALVWSAGALASGPAHSIYTLDEYLPVVSEGYRYTSRPYGEFLGILKVAEEVKMQGTHEKVRTRGMHIPNKVANNIVTRYDYTFPVSCGGTRFSLYEGDGFTALGFHLENGTVVLDTLVGGSPYTAPRLWGPYDQVLNAKSPMVTVASFNGDNGSGLMTASFLAGEVTGLSTGIQQQLGNDYSSAIYSASRCLSNDNNGKLMVRR